MVCSFVKIEVFWQNLTLSFYYRAARQEQEDEITDKVNSILAIKI